MVSSISSGLTATPILLKTEQIVHSKSFFLTEEGIPTTSRHSPLDYCAFTTASQHCSFHQLKAT